MRATTLSSSTKTLDPTYDIDSTLWTMIEENVAIICACLPACRIILALVFPDAFRSPCPPACGAVGSKGLVFTIGSAPRRLSRSHSDDDDDWQLFAGPHKGEGSNTGEDDASEESLTKPSVTARSLGLCGTPQGSARYDDLYTAGRAV
ncbi:hypothetical protein AAL_02637 [Moelleriella libera RCEF 2490]|uniref:Rhodopsin domain-containing protein n=1 Tax=Moelleriella libera RCEF 2490 TaxID=1081109 RepID=A0A168ERX2_9HYPO|nr:hypothetical protein AAL_02637 [Moelleriella libera RCEF 2490]